jgi:hypothetical protein
VVENERTPTEPLSPSASWTTTLVSAGVTLVVVFAAMWYVHERYNEGYHAGTAKALRENAAD